MTHKNTRDLTNLDFYFRALLRIATSFDSWELISNFFEWLLKVTFFRLYNIQHEKEKLEIFYDTWFYCNFNIINGLTDNYFLSSVR